MIWKVVREGKAALRVPTGKISARLSVFYNPAMEMNRDITLHVLTVFKQDKLRIADPLAGSGVRGIRIKKELPSAKVHQLWLNDANPTACKNIKENFRLSKAGTVHPAMHKTSVKGVFLANREANQFLRHHRPFDYIDIDPFGSPNPFLDSAVQSLNRTGILAVTATDTSALAGSHPKACARKYWAAPLKNEFMHETGARILIRKVQLIGAQHERAFTPILTYASEHYTRIFFRSEKGKNAVDKMLQKHAFLLWCWQCGSWQTMQENTAQCCGKTMDAAGPLWTGSLWESAYVKPAKRSFGIEAQHLLAMLSAEAQIPQIGFYDLHRIGKRHHLQLRPMKEIQEALEQQGFRSSRTHFSPTALRSDAPLSAILKALRSLNRTPAPKYI